MEKKRYLRIGFNFDDLRGMSLNEIGNLFTHEFDESFYLIDVRDEISSGHTFFLVESENLKQVEEGCTIPVLFAKERGDGSYEVPEYSQYLEDVKEEKEFSRWAIYEEEIDAHSKYDVKVISSNNFGKNKVINDIIKNHVFPLPEGFILDKIALNNGPLANYFIYNPQTGQMEEVDENDEMVHLTHHKGYFGDSVPDPAYEAVFKAKYGASPHTHSYKSYVGFTEKYDYCEVDGCKAKREYTGNE